MSNDHKIRFLADNTDVKRKTRDTEKVIKGLGTKIKSIGLFLGFGLAARLLGKVIDRFDAIGKAARSIGVDVEKFQGYAFAARRNNMELGRFSQAFQKMQRNIDDAGDGLTTATRAFNKMGLSYRQLAGLKPDQQFELVTDSLDKVKDATTRVALANEVFGRAGRMVLNMAREYRALAKEAEAFGGIVDSEVIKSAEGAKDALEGLKTVLFATVGKSQMIEYLETGLKSILQHIKDINREKKGLPIDMRGTGIKQGKETFMSQMRYGGHYGMLTAISGMSRLFGGKGLTAAQKRKEAQRWTDQDFGIVRGPQLMVGAPSVAEKEAFRKSVEESRAGGIGLGMGGSAINMGQILAGDPALRIGGHLVGMGGGPGMQAVPPTVQKMGADMSKVASMAEDIKDAVHTLNNLFEYNLMQQTIGGIKEFRNGEE